MNIKELREQLEVLVLNANTTLTEEEKMEFFNNEVTSYLQSLTDSDILYDFVLMCDSSNQRADNLIRADICIKYPNQESFYYIQLTK